VTPHVSHDWFYDTAWISVGCITRGSLTREVVVSAATLTLFLVLPTECLNRRLIDPTRASSGESSRLFSLENMRFDIQPAEYQLYIALLNLGGLAQQNINLDASYTVLWARRPSLFRSHDAATWVMHISPHHATCRTMGRPMQCR
jgi:hypothetical protein